MTEIFEDVSSEMKQMISAFIDMALIDVEPEKIPKLISDFVNIMPTEQAANFADFYFRLKLEELRNGSNNNQR